MNEAETRAELIDPTVKDVGRAVMDGYRVSPDVAITLGRLQATGKRAKPLPADCILIYRIQNLVPALKRQYQLAKDSVVFLVETQRFDTNCRQKRNAIAELKQSTLHKALVGEVQ